MEEGILFCRYADNLDLDILKSIVESRINFSKGISFPVFGKCEGVRSFTKEARDYGANEGVRLVKAGALVVDSALTKMLVNLFLLINKPNVPTKLLLRKKRRKSGCNVLSPEFNEMLN